MQLQPRGTPYGRTRPGYVLDRLSLFSRWRSLIAPAVRGVMCRQSVDAHSLGDGYEPRTLY